MGFSYCCSVSCLILSIWAVVQLVIMGILFNMEVVAFIDEAEASVYDDYEDFIMKTKQNYQSIATNCFIAAAVYFIFLLISYCCIRRSTKAERLAAKQSKDIDVLCSQNTTFPK
ncbi:ribonuclease kappa-like [Aricia agestis]|uniref:ribonuclease kappa-like n=1 Tax=Aricia agestis TaxID=91739 RepID=UPI001C208FB5|nr:ribonuclease kappa-like [Aricia agestis]